MAMKYDSRSCTITTNWEWVQTSGSGTTKTVTVSGISVSPTQEWAWDGGDWAQVGSPKLPSSYNTYNYSDSDGYTNSSLPLQSWSVGTISPPSWSGTTIDERATTSGSGTASYSGTVTKTSGEGWGAVSTTNTASSSISYDDGTYAGTLYLDSVSGSPSPPSYSGTYIGQTAQTSNSGTAYYSGDVPLKGSSGGTRPSNWSWSTLVNSAQTNPSRVYTGTIPLVIVDHDEWNSFTSRINEFRNYKLGQGNQFTFSSATSGANVWSLYNQAVNAISPMATVDQSGGFYNKLMNLRSALNSIT